MVRVDEVTDDLPLLASGHGSTKSRKLMWLIRGQPEAHHAAAAA